MYVTRRLLRSTLEEVKSNGSPPPSDTDLPMSPRKRRPLAQSTTTANESNRSNGGTNKSKKSNVAANTKIKVENGVKQSENEGDKRNKKGASDKKDEGPTLSGIGMLVDAKDSRERWCEAKILDLNPNEKSVYIHYVGWNTRYDSWLPAKCLAAHGSNTGAKKKAGASWNGKDSLFTDPTKPSVGTNKPTKSNKSKPTHEEPTTLVATPTSKGKKRPVDAVKEEEDADTAASVAKAKPQKKLKTNAVKAPTIEVAVDAVDEDSERKSRRSRKDKVDLELDMDLNVREEAPVEKKTPTKRTRSSPTAQVKAKSPKAVTPKRKPSPRHAVKDEAKANAEADDIALLKAMSPTVGMAATRRSSRAATAGRSVGGKKRKKEEDDSDEDFVVDEEAEEEEEEDEEEEEEGEEEEEEEDEALDDSDDERPRRSRGSNGKARRVSSTSTGRSGGNVSNQWQTDPAYLATREKLASIFRNRLQQRGEFGAGAFHGSFQDAMSGSSAASTPRSAAAGQTASAKQTHAQGAAKQKKKKKQRTTADDGSDAEEKAVDDSVAAYYYMQHYYHMQAYQYHQYMYHQAMMAHQLHQQPAATEGAEESKTEEGEGQEPGSQPEAAMMNGGIIDPRFIHAKMDALEQRRAHQQLYLQHYNQTTERNLQMLASSPEYLQNGTQVWREQVGNGYEPLPRSDEEQKEEDDEEAKDTSEQSEEETKVVKEGEANESSPVTGSTGKDDEAREAEGISLQKTDVEETKSEASTAVATPEPTPCSPDQLPRQQTPPALVESPSKHEEPSSEPATESSPVKKDSVKKDSLVAASSPAPGSVPTAQTEAVLFELVL